MEDVRTSEALEKEVLEDARRKAEKILKSADREIEKLRGEWKEKKEAELAALDAAARAKRELLKKEMDAAFPLETQRLKLKFMNDTFENFLREFFSQLSEDELVRILADKGKRFSAFFSGRNNTAVQVVYAGVSLEAARSVASSLLGTGSPGLTEGKGFRGLVFCGEGGAYRYRLTVSEIESELREYSRKALMDALWRQPA